MVSYIIVHVMMVTLYQGMDAVQYVQLKAIILVLMEQQLPHQYAVTISHSR